VGEHIAQLSDNSAQAAWPTCTIRAVEHRADGFVAFELIAGDPDLYVEMLLSREAFQDFVASHGLEPGGDAPAPPQTGAFPDVRLRDVALGGRNLTHTI